MKVDKHIRGVEAELWNQARADALKKGINIGDWINQAMAEKLKRQNILREKANEH